MKKLQSPFRTIKGRTFKTKTLINCILFIGCMQSYTLSPLFAQDNTIEINKAYEIRMNGKVEEAKEVLKTVLESDSTDAMAHYEMSRALEDKGKDHHINKALLYDPQNTMYRFYRANLYMLSAYKAMHKNETEQINKNIKKCCEFLNSILEIKPNCKESLLFLIDIYGTLPKEMGGNIEQAHIYLNRLKQVDPLYAAQGTLILSSKEKDLDIVDYWQKYIDENGENKDALVKLGKANLLKNDLGKAKACFDKVIDKDPSQNLLHLHIARAHLYNAMRGNENSDNELLEFKKNINLYLELEEKKPVNIEAWCYGWLGRIEEKQGNKEQAGKYFTRAKELMPDFPKYTAIPKVDEPPNLITYTFSSYFSPF